MSTLLALAGKATFDAGIAAGRRQAEEQVATLTAQHDALAAQVEQMRAVVEAARNLFRLEDELDATPLTEVGERTLLANWSVSAMGDLETAVRALADKTEGYHG